MSFLRIELRITEYHRSGEVPEIILIGYDLHMRKQIVCDRDVVLAKRMASELGIEFIDRRENFCCVEPSSML